MITRSKRNYIDYLSDHKDENGVPNVPGAEEVLRVRAESDAKRFKSTLWEESTKNVHHDKGNEDEDNKTLKTWIGYAHVLEYIADKEIVNRAYGLFHKKMKENEEFMQKAHDTFSAKNKDTSSTRAKSQLLCRHVQTMTHALFHQTQETEGSDLVTHTKEKCFEKTMKLFALESGLTRL